MRRSMLAALVSLLLVAWPARAQLFPTQTPFTTEPAPSPVSERVLFDSIVMAIPPVERAPCARWEPGQLTISARNTGESPWNAAKIAIRPVTFRLAGYRGEDRAVDVKVDLNADDSSATVALLGAVYCWSISVSAPVAVESGMAVRTNYSQFIALRMTLAPQ